MIQPMTIQPTQRVRVFLVDDQSIIRAALKSFLGARNDIEIVGDTGDPRSALEAIRGSRPDVVVLDITMPGLSGLDLLPMVRKAMPRTKVLMLTHHEGESFVEQALKSGADGYLSKDSDPSELLLAIQAVRRGDPYVSPKVTSGLVEGLRGADAGERPSGSRLAELTPRERQVFQLLALGKSNKEVASALDISLGTAKKHRENLQRKLGCGSAAELARLAIREGLLDV